ncbi:hypothetical protein OU994_14560 [Pseudoduganella sp. SL102]|uniref:hypothetical protein n=1 Tax=Pseudoduganella sp. SL102 TaxID=2995154 RepID=UPI00248AFA82|nr:hypothetical protein [Pseudoduganella sp. SL102]WBS05408.1 hypothetical protein OU994_14560 [Pseudoduganella sp. SL102]
MHPAEKFYSLVTATTIAIMFLSITLIVPLIVDLSPSSKALGSLVAILSSIGVYRIISQIAAMVIHNVVWMRKWIFGGSYLHGTWVGYFIGRNNNKRYTVEHFDQDLDGIIINGQSRDTEQKPHAEWTSISVSLDRRTGRLIYSYALNILSRQGTAIGINNSQLERTSHRSSAKTFAGHTQDLGEQSRLQLTGVKISDELLPWKYAFECARKKFP